MAQDKNHKKANADEHAQSAEQAARQERLKQLMARRSKLTADEVALLREEFPTIIAPYRERVWKRLQRGNLNPHDAEEVRQEVFFALHKHLVEYGFPEKLAAMITSITKEKLSKHRRAQKADPPSTCLASSTSEVPRSYRDAERDLDRKAIARRTLKKLSREHQDAIQLVLVNGLTHTEAAAALGLPEGTLKSRLLAATGALNTLLKAALPPSQR